MTGIQANPLDEFFTCDACTAGKITALPFPKKAERASAPLERVHTDLFGPTRTATLGGAKYMLTFTDDYTRWTETYLIREKSDVTLKFHEYKNYAENHTGRKIKRVRSDNGGEYCNTGLDQALIDAGIKRELTVPYTPQQIGVSERKNRTLIEPTRTMLYESGLPKTFWGEAAITAC